jgi:hypothetical protein
MTNDEVWNRFALSFRPFSAFFANSAVNYYISFSIKAVTLAAGDGSEAWLLLFH